MNRKVLLIGVLLVCVGGAVFAAAGMPGGAGAASGGGAAGSASGWGSYSVRSERARVLRQAFPSLPSAYAGTSTVAVGPTSMTSQVKSEQSLLDDEGASGAGGAAGGGGAKVSQVKAGVLDRISVAALSLLFKYFYFDEELINLIRGYSSVDSYERSLVHNKKPLLTPGQWEELARELEGAQLYKQAADCYKRVGNISQWDFLYHRVGDELEKKYPVDIDVHQNIQGALLVAYSMYEALRVYSAIHYQKGINRVKQRLEPYIIPLYNYAMKIKDSDPEIAMQLMTFVPLVKMQLSQVNTKDKDFVFSSLEIELVKLCRRHRELVLSIIQKLKENFRYAEAADLYRLLGDARESKAMQSADYGMKAKLAQAAKKAKRLQSRHSRKEAESEDEAEAEGASIVEPEMADRSVFVSDMAPWFEGEAENSLAARVFAQPDGYWPVRQKSAAKTMQKAWRTEQTEREKRTRLALMDMQSREARRRALLAIEERLSPVQRKQDRKKPLTKEESFLPQDDAFAYSEQELNSEELPDSVRAVYDTVLQDDEEEGAHGAGGGAAGGGGAAPVERSE
ncbi:hypothetical protein EBQ93_04335 [bacterium]|nr:hypothetical protein [bacterium]